jgi:hypothetical protein
MTIIINLRAPTQMSYPTHPRLLTPSTRFVFSFLIHCITLLDFKSPTIRCNPFDHCTEIEIFLPGHYRRTIDTYQSVICRSLENCFILIGRGNKYYAFITGKNLHCLPYKFQMTDLIPSRFTRSFKSKVNTNMNLIPRKEYFFHRQCIITLYEIQYVPLFNKLRYLQPTVRPSLRAFFFQSLLQPVSSGNKKAANIFFPIPIKSEKKSG